MTFPTDPIIVHIAGQDFSFDNVDVLMARTSRFAEEMKMEWQDRKADVPIVESLAWLAKRSDVIVALTEAGLMRLDQEKADAEAAIAEIERLVGEL